ncbi:hypothetical protein [Peptoniphilus rhinitidis]|uniref:hypothetical protein n=1 Tax=Peptoniphilus rhinitidis TaxID=1175452 RepID=UPI00028908DD|nr:hypothetical protein [Peptoniphilus rhinitidis]
MREIKNIFHDSLDYFKELSDDFDLFRNGSYIDTIKAFFCSNEYPNSIQTLDNIILKEKDILVHKTTNTEYTIHELKPITISDELTGYIVGYKESQSNNNVYNINSISGNSAIGTNAVFNYQSQTIDDLFKTIDEELPFSEEKNQLLKTLLELKSEEKPLEKKSLAKFSDLIKKHENLLIPIGTLIAKILFSVD